MDGSLSVSSAAQAHDGSGDAIGLGVLKAAVEAATEAILITSPDLDEPGPRILYANPAFARMTGYDERDLVGRSPRLLQGPATERGALRKLRSALSAGEAANGEAVNYRKDGSSYVVEWRIAPVRDVDGRITHWVSAQRDVTERRAGEDRQALLVRELHHRVKNTLATVQAVLNATVRTSPSMLDFTRRFTGRIASLAKTHALITEDSSQLVSFEGLLRSELGPYDDPGRLTLTGRPVALTSDLAVPVGMALHELTTNALQFGALAVAEGRLNVHWEIEDASAGKALLWTWSESGGPPVEEPVRGGFGSRLLNKVLATQTQAEVLVNYEREGLQATIRIPLPA